MSEFRTGQQEVMHNQANHFKDIMHRSISLLQGVVETGVVDPIDDFTGEAQMETDEEEEEEEEEGGLGDDDDDCDTL